MSVYNRQVREDVLEEVIVEINWLEEDRQFQEQGARPWGSRTEGKSVWLQPREKQRKL